MNKMIFSFVSDSFDEKKFNQINDTKYTNETNYINSTIFTENIHYNYYPEEKKAKKKGKTKKQGVGLTFSSNYSLKGPLFKNIQFANTGCGVCGGK